MQKQDKQPQDESNLQKKETTAFKRFAGAKYNKVKVVEDSVDDVGELVRDGEGNVVSKKKETNEEAVKRLKKEMYALEDRMVQIDKESNESYERDKAKKKLEGNKRLIPDA